MGKYKKFRHALQDGKEAEIRVMRLLQDGGAIIRNELLEGAGADAICFHCGVNHQVEVKNEDNYQYPKQNICIEMYQDNPPVPSGILISQATVCVHTFGPKMAIFLRKEMRQWAEHELASGRELKPMGDNNNQAIIENREFLRSHYWWFDYVPAEKLAQNPLWRNSAAKQMRPKMLFD